MADRQWYTGRDGRQEGPFSDERLRQLIASGMVRGETLVWSAGMTNWAKAAEVPGLMPAQRMPTAASGLPAPSGALTRPPRTITRRRTSARKCTASFRSRSDSSSSVALRLWVEISSASLIAESRLGSSRYRASGELSLA